MHISKGTDPFASASEMAKQAVSKGDMVLDCCSGLGYAAIAAHRIGAREVLTIELSPEVMGLRAQNPWSQDLGNDGIVQRQGSSYELIQTMAAMSFDSVVHDPPRFLLLESFIVKNFIARFIVYYVMAESCFITRGIHTLLKQVVVLSMALFVDLKH